LTRFFSVSKWYHFSFMVVSIALFGFGASGTALSLYPPLLKKGVNTLLTGLSLAFSLSCALSTSLTNGIPFDPFRFAWDPFQIGYLLIHYALLSIPFFFSGLLTGVILSKMVERVDRVYFSALTGSGIGSLLVITVLSPLSGGAIVVLVSILSLISTLIFALNLPRRSLYPILALTLASSILLLGVQSILEPRISPYKSLSIALTYPGSRTLYTGWNAFSRVDIIESPYVRYAPGLSYEFRGSIPPQLGVTVDGDGLSGITHYNGDPNTIEFVDYLPMALPYHLGERSRVLIIYPGGGLSVLNALYHGAREVVAVEINPLILEEVRGEFGNYSGGIYEDDRVRVEVGEGRSYVKRSLEEYDLIELSWAGNVAASSTGIYALTEDYMYTVEAFQEYYSSLSPGGLLSVTRWLIPPPREEVRIVSLAISALEGLGVEDPGERVAVIRGWGTFTLLLKKGTFTPGEVERVRRFCTERSFDLVYIPGISPQEVNRYNRFPEPYYYEMVTRILSPLEREALYRDYLFDLSPVSDERPFFFHFYRWDKIISIYESMGRKWQPFVEGGYLAPLVFLQALLLSLVFILLPLYRFRGLKAAPGRWRVLSYFLLLGLGYMFIEIVLIQRFILFLGHPIYAVSTVLFSILTFSGLGSLYTRKLKERLRRALTFILPLLASILLIYILALPILFQFFLGLEFPLRLLVSVAVMIPPSILMGMPFPLGITLTSRNAPDLIPWAWAVNGCASVLGSILPVIIALSLGFSTVLLLASIIYISALGIIIYFKA
jgi:glycosyltransferase involved in cell wall biosynthesis